jgi:hypothetical protein
MNKVQREFLQKAILKAITSLPVYPNQDQSDTTYISYTIADKYAGKLFELKIIEGEYDNYHSRSEQISWAIHDKVLRQVNRLKIEGYIKTTQDYGGEGRGRNYTFLRLRLTSKGVERLESTLSGSKGRVEAEKPAPWCCEKG